MASFGFTSASCWALASRVAAAAMQAIVTAACSMPWNDLAVSRQRVNHVTYTKQLDVARLELPPTSSGHP